MTQRLLFPALLATVHYVLDGVWHAEPCDTEGDVGQLLAMAEMGREFGFVGKAFVEWH